MADKRMLIVDAEVVTRIEENRGDMNCSEFLNYLIDSQLKEKPNAQNNYATKDDLLHLEQSLKEVLHSFLEFFLSYGLELGKPAATDLSELDKRLQSLGSRSQHKT